MKYALIGIVALGLILGGVFLAQQGAEKKPAPTPAATDGDMKNLKNLKLYD